MNGAMRSLNDGVYHPSYEIDKINQISFNDLTLVKLEVERELEEAFNILKKNEVTMETSLVTQDGFPRADINIVEVRNARVKIIKLRNDLKAVINEISERMDNQFTELGSSKTVSKAAISQVPFARISEIIPNSPASIAKLQVNDSILNFGNVDVTNHNNLQAVGLLVKNSVDKPIEIKILRQAQKLHIEVTPTHNWPGQGLLGCRFVQL